MKNTVNPAPEKSHTYRHPEYLVETDWLQQHLNDPELRVFDCTAHPAPNPDPELRKKYPLKPTSGRAHFEQKHISGAGFIDIPGDLSDASTQLPMMMPPEKQFVDVVTSCGIGEGTRVVLYSSTGPMWATRMWWMLRAFGFNTASVLDGGWDKWYSEGRPVSNKPCTYPPGRWTAQVRPGAIVDKEEVLAAVGDNTIRLIHALTPSVFDGSNDTVVFGRRGHIPDSINIPSATLHDPDTGTYLSSDELHKVLDAAGVRTAERIITYCGGGINATDNAFALCLLGYENVCVYDGSMCEWGNDRSLSVEMS